MKIYEKRACVSPGMLRGATQAGEQPISALYCQHVVILKKPAVVDWRNVDGTFSFWHQLNIKVTVLLLVFSYMQVAHLQEPAFGNLNITHALNYASNNTC